MCVLSAELPDGCYLRESDGQGGLARHAEPFEVVFSPESSIRPEKTCHVVPPFWFPYGGGEGGIFVPICC